uniref:CYTOCHROME C3 n=1 Tax=Nitratidesulfovibrio vulgaris (strain ATCC 29579 / DSM 644 / CCUG 34227 / NCIMB 8303 / VKM B-1760 / Hildenborough) TaxID=882 RepID=UPI00001125B8|nr:Chain A, CYTOCHROME C3 [Nitratidesulfovibrio vulgaris str. Hildenborough]1MDV_B Chain B, CYTOCHROME C3 [Nitratidesulfovibrio vulgaris str. Hildenborough]
APKAPADGLKMEATKQPVVLNHSTHKSVKCGDCHHPVNGKEDYRKCGTAGCHDSMDKKDKSAKGYYHVMHDKNTKFKSCVGCHVEVAGADAAKKKDLTGCKKSKCHE